MNLFSKSNNIRFRDYLLFIGLISFLEEISNLSSGCFILPLKLLSSFFHWGIKSLFLSSSSYPTLQFININAGLIK